jgi:hypothetical protein
VSNATISGFMDWINYDDYDDYDHSVHTGLQWQKCIHKLLPRKPNLSNRKHWEEFISVKHVIFVWILCQLTLFLPHVEEANGCVVILLLVVVGVVDVVMLGAGGGGGCWGIVGLVLLFVVDVKTVVIIVVVLVKVTFWPAWNIMKIWIVHAVEDSHYISIAGL